MHLFVREARQKNGPNDMHALSISISLCFCFSVSHHRRWMRICIKCKDTRSRILGERSTRGGGMATLEAIMAFDKLDSSRFGPGLGENHDCL